MTLATSIRILDPVPVPELFAECRRLLGAGSEVEILDSPYEPGSESREMRHKLDQGLAAYCAIEYAVERPLPTASDRAEWREWGEEPEPEHFARITFDTGYAYRTPSGAGCGDLHAWLVTEIGAWLTERGRRFEWQYEYDGSWHDSLAKLELLGDAKWGTLR